MKRFITFAACAALLAGCSPQKAAAPQATAAPPKFNTSLPIDELMGHVVDPASFVYWKGAGTEITAKGERDLSPTTDAGWEDLESAAAVLIEAGNMLQLPGRPRPPEADWNRYAQQLSDLGVQAKQAAFKHDKAGVYDLGAKIYLVCTACHSQYVIQPQLKATGPAPGNPLPDWPADVKAKQQTYAAKP